MVKKELKLDLGTGKGMNRPEGFIGVDKKRYKGVDVVCDLRKKWPWKSDTVEELNAHYLVQYLTASERVHFVNEAHRVLKKGGTIKIVIPHWCASKAYADIRAAFPPVSESWFMLLRKDVRDQQNFDDECGYKCDFDFTLGYGPHPAIAARAEEYRNHALGFFREAAQDIVCTLIKR